MADPTPEPINRGLGAFQGLVVALLALMIAAAAVILFSIIQTGVPCEFKPITYALFTGIVLAAVGSALGGQAAASGNFPSVGITAVVTGGAAFLLIAMAAVWFATRTECEPGPSLKLSSIPLGYAISRSDPTESSAYLRVRFDPEVRISQYVDSNLGYSIFFSSKGAGGLSIYVDLIQGNKSAQICDIDIKRAPPTLIKSGLLQNPDKFIKLDRSPGNNWNEAGTFELKFRPDFISEVLSQYHFDRVYNRGSNACIQIDFVDPLDGHTKPALVNEIYFTDPSVTERLGGVNPFKGDLSSLLGEFKLYAVRAAQSPNSISDITTDLPVPRPVVTTLPPESPAATCIRGNSPSNAMAVLDGLKQTGVISDDDVKALFEHWCEVETAFYDDLKSSPDATVRYRLTRFIRSSITAIDTCWASNDTFRQKKAATLPCEPKLNRPRNFSRPLPFAKTSDQKATIVDLLRDQSLQVRHEVDILLRLYPHDEFGKIFDKLTAAVDSHPEEYAQSLIPAVVSYYYNRIVEQGWAETFEKANGAATELTQGLKWTERLSSSDRAIARARLHYAMANVLVQITGDKSPPVDVANKIKVNFAELLKLSPDDQTAYPNPHHLARAVCFTSGTAEEARRFDTYSIDGFKTANLPKAAIADTINYEQWVWVLPDLQSTKIRRLTAGQAIRMLMTIATDGQSGTWLFVSTDSGLGWIKRKNRQN